MFVVAGSSGQTGSVVADTLLRQGKRVRLIARTPSRVEGLRARGAEVAALDLSDADALTEALRGARGAYLLLPPDMVSPDVMGMHRALIASFSKALSRVRPEHVVCLSSQGAHQTSGTGPVQSLHLLEAALGELLENVTFVRPTYFMESLGGSLAGLSSGVFPTFLRSDLALPMVASRDVGATAAAALLRGPRGREVIELEGPRRYTTPEVVAALSSLTSTAIQLVELPEEAVIPTLLGFGMSQQVAELSLELIHAINTGHLQWQQDAAQRVHGTTGVAEVLSGLLPPMPVASERAS